MIAVQLVLLAKVILDNYDVAGDFAFPRFSNQKINSYFKGNSWNSRIKKCINHHVHERPLHLQYYYIMTFQWR